VAELQQEDAQRMRRLSEEVRSRLLELALITHTLSEWKFLKAVTSGSFQVRKQKLWTRVPAIGLSTLTWT
jgi:hypothetical protein